MQNLLIIFILALALNTQAQESVLTPENIQLDSKLIQEENYEMDWFIEKDSARIKIGTVSTEIKKTEGNLLIKTIVKMKQSPIPWVDSTMAKLPNLAPIRHSSHNLQRNMVLDFGKTVTGYYLDKKTNVKTEVLEKPEGGYFDSNLYPQLIRWLPLDEGYKKTIRIFNYSPKEKGVMNAYIKNVEKGMLDDKKVWKVTVTDDISNNKVISTYYIDKQTRKILKHEIDMGGRKMIMELAQK